MLRTSPAVRGRFLMLYHPRALPLKAGYPWNGNWGAINGKMHNTVVMSEEVKGGESIAAIDRKMMNYVHETKMRHYQLEYSYHERPYSSRRVREENKFYRRRRDRKVKLSYIAFMQHQVHQQLKQKADYVTQFGQAAVNRALGDPADEPREAQEKRWNSIRRRVIAPPIVGQPPRHVVTRQQRTNDRFDMRFRQF